jgi:8-oxo-dGTP pyrophosphatase MutT (NUDIX family)
MLTKSRSLSAKPPTRRSAVPCNRRFCCRLAELLNAEEGQCRQIRRSEIPRKPRRPKIKPALRIQYAALPYRFTPDAALEILLVTTRRSKRWIIPKGWPIKGLRPTRSAAREAFEEAGVRGKIGAKSVGLFRYNKLLDEQGIEVSCEVKVFPLHVRRQSESWPEREQRLVQWVEPAKALSLIKERQLRKLVAAFAKRVAAAARKSSPRKPA